MSEFHSGSSPRLARLTSACRSGRWKNARSRTISSRRGSISGSSSAAGTMDESPIQSSGERPAIAVGAASAAAGGPTEGGGRLPTPAGYGALRHVLAQLLRPADEEAVDPDDVLVVVGHVEG